MALPDCGHYRPRQPRATPLCRLVDARHDELRAQWEERFETRYGFWRSLTGTAVAAFFDCGILDNGFARGTLRRVRGRVPGGLLVQGAGSVPVLRRHARGGWDRDDRWAPIPYVDQTAAAELLGEQPAGKRGG